MFKIRKLIYFFGMFLLLSCGTTPPDETKPNAQPASATPAPTAESASVPLAPDVVQTPPAEVLPPEYVVLVPADLPPRPPSFSEFKEGEAKVLTKSGENFNGVFSRDGKKVLFIGRNRPQHLYTQVYELDLETLKEKRVTHQDGIVVYARYLNENKLVYASTTDEQKEDLDRLVKNMKGGDKDTPLKIFEEDNLDLPLELYLSNADGSDMARLTDSRGYDGSPSVDPKGRSIVFTSFRFGDGDLFQLNLPGGKPTRITTQPGIDIEPQYSRDGLQLVWIRRDRQAKTSVVMLANENGKKSRQLELRPGIYQNPSFMDNTTLLFSSNFEEPGNFEIYAMDLTSQCIRRVTNNPGQDRLPVGSPDGKKLLFTSARSGQDHLYLMDFVPSQACIPAQ